MQSETERKRQAALRLGRQAFDRLPPDVVGAIAQAFGTSGRIYSTADRNRVWDAIQRYRMEHSK